MNERGSGLWVWFMGRIQEIKKKRETAKVEKKPKKEAGKKDKGEKRKEKERREARGRGKVRG